MHSHGAEIMFNLLKALGRYEMEPDAFSQECRELTIEDILAGMESFSDLFGPGLPVDAITAGNLPVEPDPVAECFVAIDGDERLDEFPLE